MGLFTKRRGPRRIGGDGDVQVFCADEQADVSIDIDRWQRLATDVLRSEGVKGACELSLLFVDAGVIAELNRVHMGKSGPTDVLSFPIDAVLVDDSPGPGHATRGPDRPQPDSDDHPLLLGDVVLCPAVARDQAPQHAGSVDDEIALLVTHGVLHVLGYDHAEEADKVRMQSRERELLETHHWKGSAPLNFRIDHRDEQ
ncbi:MAG: hypothetical protein RJB08_496 [Actinomycetota bacterium]|jgi:probable rRNA maturation factor